jgi:18S rRNA (guanine1575-N7)-methyltransferase
MECSNFLFWFSDVANDREVEGDLFLHDIGQGVGFRPGTFDGAISISVIQWLCVSSSKAEIPQKRLARFFNTLYSALARGARAVFQFYPENPDQAELIVSAAMKAGFTGGLIVDYPNSSKAKKYFLCLFAGYKENPSAAPKLPMGLGQEGDGQVAYSNQRRVDRRKKNQRKPVKDKNWILAKKELSRKRGKKVAADSKFTARKRRVAF